jgi:hypothetical protein
MLEFYAFEHSIIGESTAPTSKLDQRELPLLSQNGGMGNSRFPEMVLGLAVSGNPTLQASSNPS